MKIRRPADNPFASHRVEALPFRMDGVTTPDLAERAGAMGRAAIVGPEGSGKTTLLEELSGWLGDRSVTITLPGSCRHPWRTARDQLSNTMVSRQVVLVDGCEQLGLVGWYRLFIATRRARSLIVTLHRPGRLPTLIECRTSPELMRELASELAPEEMHEIDPMLEELFDRHGGNIRLCFRELYDVCAGRLPPPS